MKTIDRILIILGVFVGLFIVTMIVLFCIFQAVPDTLIVAVLGTGTSEAILTCVITCVKTKAGIENEDDDI